MLMPKRRGQLKRLACFHDHEQVCVWLAARRRLLNLVRLDLLAEINPYTAYQVGQASKGEKEQEGSASASCTAQAGAA